MTSSHDVAAREMREIGVGLLVDTKN
jgi:hypothetical protein